MKSNCWKYPKKGELPELSTTVLCFTGGRKFGQYELGSMEKDFAGELIWVMENDQEICCEPCAWCNVPDAPDFMEFI